MNNQELNLNAQIYKEMKNLEILPTPISKKDLVVGKKYSGICRNTSEAVWNGKVFEYKRYKFGFFDDTVNHYEDDDGYDVFVPFELIQ
jgi:hypothetical protein